MNGRLAKLVLTIDGKRFVYAAVVPSGKEPEELTLGEWMAAPARSGAALLGDFLDTRPSQNGADNV